MRRGATAFFVVTVVTLASVLPATQGLRGSAYPAAELARSVDSQHNHRHHQHEGKEGMLRRCFEDLKELVKEKSCAPLLVRLAWHEAGTYDKNYHNGGADGTIRFDKELAHPNDAGLENARALLQPMKQSYPDISYADLYQMASAAAIEASGGPRIPMRYGRVDAETDASVPPVNRLPDGRGPFHQGNGPCPFAWSWNPSPADHLRRVFHRMGLNDKEIVALSGGHTLGRAYKDRSGLPPLNETKYTVDGPGTRGGMSWTRDWLRFDNSYFSLLKDAHENFADPDLLRLPTDDALFEDKGFRKYAEIYATSEKAFFHDYALAHAKLSELGATFEPPEGIKISFA